MGFEAAMLVGRVATEGTVQAWLDRAQQRTFKHLAEEVSTAEVLARTSSVGEQPPPSEQTQAAMMALESTVLSGRVFRGETEVDRGHLRARAVSLLEPGVPQPQSDAPPHPLPFPGW